MTTKKLSELDVLESLSAGAYAVLEENGEAKRYPANMLGSVKTVNGVEADENGNVEIEIPDDGVKTVNGIAPDEAGNVEIEIPEGFSGKWDDLADKPFNRTVSYTDTLQWNGDAINAGTLYDWTKTWAKISDVSLPPEYFIEGNCSFYSLDNDGDTEFDIGESNIKIEDVYDPDATTSNFYITYNYEEYGEEYSKSVVLVVREAIGTPDMQHEDYSEYFEPGIYFKVEYEDDSNLSSVNLYTSSLSMSYYDPETDEPVRPFIDYNYTDKIDAELLPKIRYIDPYGDPSEALSTLINNLIRAGYMYRPDNW